MIFPFFVERPGTLQSSQLHLTQLLFEVAHNEDVPSSFVGREWLFREMEEVKTFWVLYFDDFYCRIFSNGFRFVLVIIRCIVCELLFVQVMEIGFSVSVLSLINLLTLVDINICPNFFLNSILKPIFYLKLMYHKEVLEFWCWTLTRIDAVIKQIKLLTIEKSGVWLQIHCKIQSALYWLMPVLHCIMIFLLMKIRLRSLNKCVYDYDMMSIIVEL